MGESVIIGDSVSDANILTVSKSTVSGELVDLRVDTLLSFGDILNMETSPATPDNTQFIECRKGNIKFSIDTDGSVYANKQIKTDSSIIVGDEVNRVATGSANLIPVAYGNVQSDGTILSGTGNFSVVNAATGRYEISISGESFSFQNYTVIAALGGSPGFVFSTGSGGVLYVFTDNTSGVDADSRFNFVVYKN